MSFLLFLSQFLEGLFVDWIKRKDCWIKNQIQLPKGSSNWIKIKKISKLPIQSQKISNKKEKSGSKLKEKLVLEKYTMKKK
jgi:hypothetical protein